MRDEAKRNEGASFPTGKTLAAIYMVMFVAVVGMGVHKQIDRIMPGAPAPTSLASIEVPVR